MLRVLASLDERWVKAGSGEICSNLSKLVDSLVGPEIKRILAWTHFFPGEVDLTGFVTRQLQVREVYLPRVLPDYSMTFLSINEDWLHGLEPGELGIPEPAQLSGKIFDCTGVEDTIVIVPGLAFDAHGHRLGRGKGCYDRFLGGAGLERVVKVGVCWQLQIIDHITVEAHDVDMNWICHEREYAGGI